jgi:G3E family GTPase
VTVTRYIMVGGFLGAGKTTAMLRFGQHLADKGLRVGLITNDQSSGLVDTTMLSASGFPVRDHGRLLCCRFTSLTNAAERLTVRTTPDVFLAEPVGSCTDLKATVSYRSDACTATVARWRPSAFSSIRRGRCGCSDEMGRRPRQVTST